MIERAFALLTHHLQAVLKLHRLVSCFPDKEAPYFIYMLTCLETRVGMRLHSGLIGHNQLPDAGDSFLHTWPHCDSGLCQPRGNTRHGWFVFSMASFLRQQKIEIAFHVSFAFSSETAKENNYFDVVDRLVLTPELSPKEWHWWGTANAEITSSSAEITSFSAEITSSSAEITSSSAEITSSLAEPGYIEESLHQARSRSDYSSRP